MNIKWIVGVYARVSTDHDDQKIRCTNCNSNYRFIKERGVNKYVCSGYSRQISDCKRYVIKEENLLYIVQIFCNRNNMQLQYTNEFMKNIIDRIYADGENNNIIIAYKNNEEGIYSVNEIHI